MYDMRTTPDRTGEQLCWSAPGARAAALDGGSMVSYTDRTRKVVRIAASFDYLIHNGAQDCRWARPLRLNISFQLQVFSSFFPLSGWSS
jgi:hypothetical protein